MLKPLFLVALACTLMACRHPLFIIGEGDIMSASGERDCLLEDFQGAQANCTENTVNGRYKETYFAVPRSGSQFVAWGNYCAKGLPADECDFKASKQQVQDSPIDEAPPLVAYFREEVTQGHHAITMGHSFFNPFAGALPADAAAAGFEDHTQVHFSSGGSGGAPLSFWNSAESNTDIKSALDAGGMTLLGNDLLPPSGRGHARRRQFAGLP